MYGKAEIIGRIVRESNGPKDVGETQVYENCVAYDQGWGERKHGCFLEFKIWGKRAAIFHQYVSKGERIHLSGNLDQEHWEGKEGEKRSKFVLNVQDFTFLTSASDKNAKPVEADVDDIDDPGSVPF